MQLREKPLIDEDAIRQRIRELGEAVRRAYEGRDLVFVVVLKGSFVFAADLMRAAGVPCSVCFVRAQSYDGTCSNGHVRITLEPEDRLEGKHLLVVEDILDTGLTVTSILECLEKHRPASLALCTLLDKPARRKVSVSADYVGFEIDNEFVVGYGLDFDEQYRNLPAIHVLQE